MAGRIDIATAALILSFRPAEFMRPRPWLTEQERQAGPPVGMSSTLSMVSWWTADEIRDSFQVANQVWEQANIRFSPVHIERRTERVQNNERTIYVDLTNRLGRVYDRKIVAAFVQSLASNHGGIAGGRLAIVAKRLLTNQSTEMRGVVLAHELGHVLGLADRFGPNVGNLMFHNQTPGGRPNRDLDEFQARYARERAERLFR